MAILVKIVETSDDIEAQQTALNAAIAALGATAVTCIAVDGGLHRCRIYILYTTA